MATVLVNTQTHEKSSLINAKPPQERQPVPKIPAVEITDPLIQTSPQRDGPLSHPQTAHPPKVKDDDRLHPQGRHPTATGRPPLLPRAARQPNPGAPETADLQLVQAHASPQEAGLRALGESCLRLPVGLGGACARPGRGSPQHPVGGVGGP